MEEHPPWFTTPDNSYAGRILALARCVFDMHYEAENHLTKGTMKTFDNKCASDLERTAQVLNLAGFIQFIDDIGRRSVFICEPINFEAQSKSKNANDVDPDMVTEAVKWLARGHFRSSEEIEFLEQNLS